jgi:rubrerythrin
MDEIQKGRASWGELEGSVRAMVDRVPAAHRILFVAMLERNAADRYREWAAGTHDAAERSGLLACAAREEEIATTVEALVPEAQRIQGRFGPFLSELQTTLTSRFGVKSRAEQLAVQAAGERAGGRTWRALAADESNETVATALRRCAALEEDSADFLETLLSSPPRPLPE